MWRRLTIRNFRSIEQADITFGRFSVLVGKNSVGKSNVADALAFFAEMSSLPDLAITRRGGIRSVLRRRRDGAAVLGMSLKVAATRQALDGERGCDTCHDFELRVSEGRRWSMARQSVRISGAGRELAIELRDGRVTAGELDAPLPELEPTASILPYLRGLKRYAEALRPLHAVRRCRPSPRAMSTPCEASDETLLAEDGHNVANAVDHLRQASPAAWSTVLAGMERIIPGLVDIDVEPMDGFRRLVFRQVLDAEPAAPLSTGEISDGALQALAILVAAAQTGNGDLLIVEEPESHLYPGAARIVYEQLRDAAERGSVVLTTHSPEFLDAAGGESILVCRYESGHTLVGPLAESQRSVIRQGLFTVAELIRSEDLRIEGSEVASIRPAQVGG